MNVSPTLVFATNANILLHFRTGTAPAPIDSDRLTREVHTSGYVVLRAAQMAVLLVDQNSDCLTKKKDVERMVAHVFTERFIASTTEVIIAAIVDSSHWYTKKLTRLMAEIARLNAGGRVYVRLDVSGGLAFNPLNRPAFAVRRALLAHLDGSPQSPIGTRKLILETDHLSTADKNNYLCFLNTVHQFPPLEESDAVCMWNGYRAGDVIGVQTLSFNAIGPLNIYRVTPARPPKQKMDVEEDED